MIDIQFTPIEEGFQDEDQKQEEISDFGFTPLSEMGEEKRKPQEVKEGPLRDRPASRLGGQLALRGAESIVSIPRETAEFLESIVPTELLQKGAEKLGLGRGAEFLMDSMKKYAPYKLFPTAEQTREFTKELFGDLFEPKSEAEEKIGETFGEFAALTFPFLGAVKPLRAFLLSTGANAAKSIGDWVGLGDKNSNRLKLGTYVVGSLIHPKAAENFYKRNYKAARDILPENAKVDTQSFASKLDELESGFKKGGISSADKPALQQIKNIRNEMEGAVTPVDSIVEFKKKLNIARGDIYKQLEGNKSGIKTANRNLEMISNATDGALDTYAQYNPTWGKFQREANNSFAAVKSSERASKFLKSKLPKIAITHVGLSALLGHFAGIQGAITAGVAGTATVPVYHAAQTLNKIMRSKPLRKEYFNLYQEAAKGNLPAVAKSVRLLDEGLKGEE